MFGQDFTIFDENIDSCDIIQGTLGNCYFLSALSAMAEFPERVKRLFELTGVNQNSCYLVKFCINGEFVEVMIDDYFPWIPSRSAPTGYAYAFS